MEGEKVMTYYKYLGYGFTDENGVAQLKYDENGDELEHSYAGVGAGEVDVLASLDKPIVDGSIVSGTSSVLDCTFYDKGLDGSGNHNDNWENLSNNFEVTRGSEYTTLKPTQNGTYNRFIVPSVSIPSTPFVLEFNKPVFTGTGSQAIIVIGSRALYFNYYGIANANHCKFQVNSDGSIYIWMDGERQSDSSYNVSGGTSVRFQVQDNVEAISIKFSEFKIYPI